MVADCQELHLEITIQYPKTSAQGQGKDSLLSQLVCRQPADAIEGFTTAKNRAEVVGDSTWKQAVSIGVNLDGDQLDGRASKRPHKQG